MYPRLLLLFFLFGLASCSKQADKRGGGDVPATPAANPSVVVTAAEAEAGERLVARLMAAMGGREAIGAIRTLSLDGTMVRSQPGGGETEAKVRTLVKFPNMYRQELTLSAGRVTTLLGPSGGWILTAREAPLPLPTDRRLEIENIILRNPVALLKTRQSPLFAAAVKKDKSGAETLVIDVGTKETRILLDSRGLIETMSYELPAPGRGPGTRLTVTYSDYRSVGSIQYPFVSSAVSDGTPMYRVALKTVQANEPLPGTVFEPPSGGRGR
jgi:hypothetical protein